MEIHVSGDARMRNNPKANRLKSTAIEMQVSNDTKTSKYLEAVPLKSARIEQHVGKEENRPKNLKANILPTEGYGLEVDGSVKSQYETAEAAAKAGLELSSEPTPARKIILPGPVTVTASENRPLVQSGG